ncbi:hypothetical protein HORIV_16560 [Vreelandella olivaria]|uniref:Uncharacterized protein n=1 Tax=Vreelandella olivaria TaxID=390919 RepID=A0ABM8HKE5_9GAMM|nr:hypothetical protein HORIV_16560 [Halomonas olivaria]
MDQVLEFIDFHPQEAQAQQEGNDQPHFYLAYTVGMHCQNAHAKGEATDQQCKGTEKNQR